MTAGRAADGRRGGAEAGPGAHREPRDEIGGPRRGLRVPWLALAGVAATIAAAATLVAGIGDTLPSRDRSPGRLLPLQAASPPPASAPDPDAPDAEPPSAGPPEPAGPPPETRIHDALLRLRSSVYQGVAAGDVRDDVGLDLTNVIEHILDRPWSPLDRRRADVARLQYKISTRAREGAISGRRAERLRLILDAAAG
ncbi:hypothetical protein [Actinomadura sp. GTD37]|uniref:hypothetical protein n=1 Tax=Actinomadura sp. GTD37 TaxID=1778030 RepID=UPI0035BF8026